MNQKVVNGPAVKGSFGKKPVRLCYRSSKDFKGLFTWSWGSQVHVGGVTRLSIIFNLITFT